MARHLALIALAIVVGAIACGSSPPPTHPTPEQEAKADQLLTGPDWYRHAVFYEVDVRSFMDSNADGIGDLTGLASKLDYLKDLGIDAIWLMPIYPTAFKDSGYDISDYRNVSSDYGDLAAFDALLAAAHQRKMRVIMDLVLNHTSDQHAWFQDSQSSKTSAHADWYVWSDTPSDPNIGCGPYAPTFGDTAWTLSPTRNQYYFHRFYPAQPDLNYRNPAVQAEMLATIEFWLQRGIDGFRCDAVGLLFESASSCLMIPETLDYLRQIRQVVDQFPNTVLVAETDIGIGPVPYFGNGSDMFHMAFDFPYGYFWAIGMLGESTSIAKKALTTVTTQYPPGAQDAMLIGSHDVGRAWTKAQELAWRMQRATEVALFSKATPFIYYGDELALHDGTTFVVDSRDSARTPFPWDTSPNHGFTTSATPWIPFADGADQTNVKSEDADGSSMLTFHRQLLAFRRGHAVWGTGDMIVLDSDNTSVLAFVRKNAEEAYLVTESFSADPQDATMPAAISKIGDVVWGSGNASTNAGNLHVTLPASGSAVFAITP
jgi:maltose alpha-D-glucosyltransferase/alpha-amylase